MEAAGILTYLSSVFNFLVGLKTESFSRCQHSILAQLVNKGMRTSPAHSSPT